MEHIYEVFHIVVICHFGYQAYMVASCAEEIDWGCEVEAYLFRTVDELAHIVQLVVGDNGGQARLEKVHVLGVFDV